MYMHKGFILVFYAKWHDQKDKNKYAYYNNCLIVHKTIEIVPRYFVFR